MGGLEQHKFILLWCRRPEVLTAMLAGLVLSLKENLLLAFSEVLVVTPSNPSLPWLVAAELLSLPLSSHGLAPVSVSSSPLISIQSSGI